MTAGPGVDITAIRELLSHPTNFVDDTLRALPPLPKLASVFRRHRTDIDPLVSAEEQAVLDELADEAESVPLGYDPADLDVLTHSAISYPFENPMPSRYSDGRSYGVWYAACEKITLLREAAQGILRHYHDAVDAAVADSRPGFGTERYIVRCRVDGLLANLIVSPMARQYRALLTDNDWHFCQVLGAEASRQVPGVLFPLAREIGGRSVGAFREDIVGPPEPISVERFRFRRLKQGLAIEIRVDGYRWRLDSADR